MEHFNRFLQPEREKPAPTKIRENPRLMVVGEKESFLIRALLGKCDDAAIESFFVKADLLEVSRQWSKALIIAYYLERGESPGPDLVHYIKEHLQEDNKQLILIGDPEETEPLKEKLGKDEILAVYPRPLDTNRFIRSVSGYMSYLTGAEREEKRVVMIVDDDPTYCGLLRDWLGQKYRVLMARSGKQALSILTRNTPELMLLDYEMPEMTGPEVFAKMSENPGTAKIPVIFLTGKSDRESVVSAVSLKPEGYLLKSIDRTALLRELSGFFRKKEIRELHGLR